MLSWGKPKLCCQTRHTLPGAAAIRLEPSPVAVFRALRGNATKLFAKMVAARQTLTCWQELQMGRQCHPGDFPNRPWR